MLEWELVWTRLIFQIHCTLQLRYLCGFFILFCSKILFREQFIWRKYHSPGKSMFVWPLAFFSFIFPFQDRVWPFLSISPWANTISFQSLDPKKLLLLFFVCFYQKRKCTYSVSRSSGLTGFLCALEWNCVIWTSLIWDMLLIGIRPVFIFSCKLSMKRGHAKQTNIVNGISETRFWPA